MKKSSQRVDPSFGQGLELAGIITKAIASAAKKTKADSDRIQEVIGKPGVIFKFIEGLFTEDEETKNSPSILRLISGYHDLKLKASDGSRLIYQAEDTFKAYIDPDFVNWGINKPGVASAEMSVQVHEIIDNATFMDVFQALPGTWEEKCLPQDKVADFCETLPNWLRQEGYATFFLVKKDENMPIDEKKPDENLVVVCVRVRGVGLSVDVDRLGSGLVWDGRRRHRVVSPQLMPLAE